MIKEHINVYRKLAMFVDLSIVTGSYFYGYYLRGKNIDFTPIGEYAVLLPVLLIIWGVLLHTLGAYRSFRISSLPDIMRVVYKVSLFGFIFFAGFLFLFKIQYLSRQVIIFTFTTATILICTEKAIMITFLRAIRKKGHNFRRVLIVGTGKRAQHLVELLKKHDEWGMKAVGYVDEDGAGQVINGHKVLGTFDEFPQIVENNVIDDVIFVVPHSWLDKIENMIYFCETEGLKVSVAVDFFKPKFAKASQIDLEDIPLLTFESAPNKAWDLLIKRVMDIAISLVSLIILMPVIMIAGVAIKWTSKGPALFKQKRCGLSGRVFALYKFRTMVEGAEKKREDLLSKNELNGPAFKITNDPRITKLGKKLRSLSIDEIPQLWNVLRGDMSLVGPRPLPVEENKYDPWQRRRLSVKPGLTCLWQISGRNKITDFDDWAKLDLKYIDNWSLGLDFKILARTIPAVLFARGAK